MRVQRSLLLLTALALVLSSLPASSQERARARTQTRERAPARAVRAQPALEAALLLPAIQAAREAVKPAPPRAEGRAPSPLSASLKKQAIDQASGVGSTAGNRVAAPSQSLESVTLSAKRPWSANRAYLSAFLPSSFDADSGVVELNINYGGWIDVNLNVEANASYLVDMSTQTWGDGGTWKIEIGDEQIEIQKGPGEEHVLFAVQSPAKGWVTVRIRREGSGCRVFEVAVDRAG